jgi:cytochrome c oxidase assembly protein subunit 11
MDALATRRNRTLALASVGAAVGMLGFAYAAATFYSAFCRAFGLYGATQVASKGSESVGGRTLTVLFDANVVPGLDWRFEPETASLKLRTGKTATVYFRAQNLAGQPVAANALFNVTPEISGPWFDKIQCFCFQEQRLGPHESAEWPVVFFLDPKLETDASMAGVDAITLSYTLFAARDDARSTQ